VFSLASLLILTAAVLPLALVGFLIYIMVKYGPVVGRIFENAPVFRPLSAPAEPDREDVRFNAGDGVELAGSYYRAHTPTRAGVIVFCHEFLGDRFSVGPYAKGLRELGFDLFSFDFRNHGESAEDPAYAPLQWVSDLEVRDLRAALAYLKTRPDSDPAGVALFGVSRGGGTALIVAAETPNVWGVITDSAFPTHGTMKVYINRWAEIYVNRVSLWLWPNWFFQFAGWTGRMRTQWKRGRRYPVMERAVARLAPRPWLMIHGACDNYIKTEIAQALFAHAKEPKDLWIVPKAKHNRSRDVNPAAYAERISAFLRDSAPRRLAAAPERAVTSAEPVKAASASRLAVTQTAG
jgi:pimeloyl-ACP methyl ester carboxylesterase